MTGAVRWALLETLPEHEREQLLASCRRRQFARGEVLFHEGDLADSVHVLIEGRAAIGVSLPTGETATLTLVGPGATFGEVSLVANPPIRSATVTAVESCRTLTLSGPDFARARAEHPAVERYLLEELAAQVRRLTEQLLEALYVPADQRVLRRLVGLAALYDGLGGPADIPVTQTMLASMAGTSRVTTNQALNRAKSRGHIEVARGRIRVVDLAGLQRMCR